jgi:phage-related protein
LDLIVSLALGIADALPKLIPTVLDVIKQIVQTLTEPETLSNLLSAALAIIVALAEGIGDTIPSLVDTIVSLIENIVVFLTDPNNLAKLVNAAIKIIISLGSGIIAAIPRLLTSFGTLIISIVDNFKNTDWAEVGKNIVDGLLGGLKKAWTSLTKWFTDAWDGLVGGVKDLLGIHSPSRVFAGIGKNMALGIGEGWDDEFGDIQKGINSSMFFDDATFGVSSYSGGGMLGGFGGTTFGTVNINIEGYNAQDDDELAEMIAEKLQIMTERKGAVFA